MAAEDWRPTAPFRNLKLRARILAGIRAFFAARSVLEVETPALSRAAVTAPYLESFSSLYHGPGSANGRPLYLHTSPEFPMKRLLAAGSGPIYQIARVFRQGEMGSRHNPEFSMLEWYRPTFDHHALMDEVDHLVGGIIGEHVALGATERLSYAEAFQRYAAIDPFTAGVDELRQHVKRHNIGYVGDLGEQRDAWLDLILTHQIEPHLGDERLTFIYDYPASQAALARVRDGNPPVAERFELYFRGMELANGFHELADAGEQRRRFEAEQAERQAQGLDTVPMDENLLAALNYGLPDCSGVALGVDRLVMIAAGADSIEDVIAFPLDRA